MDNIKKIWTTKIDPLLVKKDGLKFFSRTLLQMVETEYRKTADKMNAFGNGYTMVKCWTNDYQSNIHLEYQPLELNTASLRLLSCRVSASGNCEFEWEVSSGLNAYHPQRWADGNNVLMSNGILAELIQGLYNISLQMEKLRKTLDKKEKKSIDQLLEVKKEFLEWGLEKLRRGDWLETNGMMFRYRGQTFHPDAIQWVVEKSGRRGSLNFTVGTHQNNMERTPIASVSRILEEIFIQMC